MLENIKKIIITLSPTLFKYASKIYRYIRWRCICFKVFTNPSPRLSFANMRDLVLPESVILGDAKLSSISDEDGLQFIKNGPFSYASSNSKSDSNSELDNNLIVMLVVSALRIDPRVEREARTLVSSGYHVCIICPDLSQPPLHSVPIDWGVGIDFYILDWSAANYVNESQYLDGALMLAAALRYKPLAFHCHDLNTSIVGLTASRIVGCKCVCDFHEWFSENVSWDVPTSSWKPHPDEVREIYRAAERLVMSQADEVITVCESIADELNLTSGKSERCVSVIRNIPSHNQKSNKHVSLRKQLGVANGKLLLLWQGGTGPTRLLEPVIEALKFATKITFVIRGPSLDLFGEGYKSLAREHGVEDRLILLPPVESAEVVAAANGADVGIWTLPKLSKNFYYALPNKIFEYLYAELPLLCANFPEAEKIINKYQVGLTFDPYDPQSIASAMVRISEKSFFEQCKKNIPLALNDMKADKEWEKLVHLYDQLKSKP